MSESTSTILPNTTQVPNIIFDDWMPRLSDVEFRVLLVVVRQTLGWIEDPETKRRKEKDWISHSQLSMKTGKSGYAISKAIRSLVSDHHLIEAIDSKGRLLDTPEKRTRIGRGGKIFYRLNVHAPALSLFDKPLNKATKKGTKILGDSEKGTTFLPAKNEGLQKKPIYTKDKSATGVASEEKTAQIKEKSPHALFMEFWSGSVERTRGFKPKITAADGMNLKRVLATGIDPSLLERICIFFLADYQYKKFSPTLSTMLSAGILNGLLNRTKNDPEFYKSLDRYADQYLPRRAAPAKVYGPASISSALADLMQKFKMPGSERREEYAR